MSERKLFRPNLNQYRRNRDYTPKQPGPRPKENDGYKENNDSTQQSSSPPPPSSSRHRQPPPEQTGHENYYYVKQTTNKCQLIVVLNDGEEIRGWIEWYDRNCIKIHTHTEQNYLIYKHSIKYITKEKQG
jgi:RNA chaperone Hfq